MSDIFDFSEKIGKDKETDFVSYEALMQGNEEEIHPDPLEELRKEEERVRRQAEEMISRAEAEKKRIEEEAYQKGFEKGAEAGRQAGRQEFDAKIAQALQLIAALEGERLRICRLYEGDLLALVKTMVERLVNHEVSVNPLVIGACLRKAMEFIVEDSTVMVHLQGDDFQKVKEMTLEDPTILEGAKRIELVEDPSISAGGCLLKTEFGEIDATLENCRDKLFECVERAFLAALSGEGEE